MEPLVAGDELLEAQAHIWNHMAAFVNSMSLKCAIQLGIPNAIHRHGSNPMPLSLLVSSLHLHPTKTQSLYRLMRLLSHSGFFVLQKEDEEEEEGYMLTKSSRLLVEDNPCSVTPLIHALLHPKLVEPWQFFSALFQTDDGVPVFKTAHGMPFWEYMENNPKDGEIFNAGMASDARLVMSLLLEKHKYVFEGIESLVDVGGGTGTVAKAIPKVFPQIECTSFDLPQVVANLNHNNPPNFKYVEGDMFKHIPSADAILLKWILHEDFGEEQRSNYKETLKRWWTLKRTQSKLNYCVTYS
ncbi:probable O-methyltransferase 3 [Cucumis melo]|uniref:Probable O-methyltransferase 3 n=1 Tax=Cucumis melo TaxID=3656 RepID=A0A1S4E070_CUCME|nr:probable O-methyltransferase 3 [Cucumis melo]